ncbi:unnamed protein product [Allacma fusca]|uniref:Uncharacterized protein n=1 Tax=Allacma fusca TaxID=39272 RepID=A0A8J2P6A0_9HEXA|nr:unnamed protein product [Allacma fusca]
MIRTPETPMVLSSFAPDPNSWLILSILIPINLYIILCGYSYAFMWGLPLLPILLAMLNVIHEITIGRKQYSSSSGLRSEAMLVEYFRRIQVLISFANKLYSSYAIPAFKWLFLLSCVYALYGSVVNHGFTSFFLFVSFSGLIFILGVFVALLGRTFDYSTVMLRSWRGHLITEPYRTMSRSFYPLRFSVSSYYFLDCRTVLTLLAIIFEYTVHLLIS